MIEFSWNFTGFKVFPNIGGMENVVFCIEWSLRAKEDDYFSEISGNSYISGPDENNFIEFNNLTQAIVEDWIEQSIDQDVLLVYKNELTEKIESMKSSTMIKSMRRPW